MGSEILGCDAWTLAGAVGAACPSTTGAACSESGICWRSVGVIMAVLGIAIQEILGCSRGSLLVVKGCCFEELRFGLGWLSFLFFLFLMQLGS